MILTPENIEKIKKFKAIMDKGHYASSNDITDTYNEVFADRVNFKKLANTNCGTCMRHRIGEMYGQMKIALEQIEKDLKKVEK